VPPASVRPSGGGGLGGSHSPPEQDRARGAVLAFRAVLGFRAVLACAAGALLAGACMETRRSLGEDCLKDSDCLSGVCAQLVCAAAPPTTDTPPVAEAGSGGTMDSDGSGD
jgi:hypothetical protein